MRADVTDRLIGTEGFRFAEWREAGLLKTIKSGPHRAVYRLTLDTGCYYLKHYRVGDLKAILQNIVRPSRAIRERTAAEAIAALGIATIDTVGVGLTRRFGLTLDSYLACEAIDNTQSLDVFVQQQLKQLPSSRRHTIRHRLAQEMGRLVATLHRGGIIHRDLHAENILVRLESNDTVRLWLIDLHAVSVEQKLTLPRIQRNLALLNPALVHELTNIDRLRFFRSYWRELVRGQGAGRYLPNHFATLDRKSVANDIVAFCRQDLIRIEHRRDKKWAQGNRRLLIADAKQIRCRGLAGLGREQLLSLRDNIGSLVESGQGRATCHTLPVTTNTIPVTLDGQPTLCRVQAHEVPVVRNWRRLFGAKSPVQRAWELGHACLRRSIPVAKPLAFVESNSCGQSQQHLLLEQLSNAVALDVFLDRPVSANEDAYRITKITVNLAQLLNRLHSAGFDYTPLDVASLLVDADDSDFWLWFASPTSLRQQRPQTVDRLAELYNSAIEHRRFRLTDTVRFLRHYLAERFAHEWKTIWRAVRHQVKAAPTQQSTDRPFLKSA